MPGVTVLLLVSVTALTLLPLACPDAVKRSDDVPPLQAVVDHHSTQLADLQAELQAVKNDLLQLKEKDNQRVAFTATIQEASLAGTSQCLIRFSHAIVNIGHAYDTNTGVFTAPYGGDYMFLVTVDVSSGYAYLDVRRNGHVTFQGGNDGGGHHIVAGGVLSLQAGDTVTVNHGTGVTGAVDGGPESIFTGYRIF